MKSKGWPSISIFVAVDDKWGISRDGKIPWIVPEDKRFFIQCVKESSVVMGRKTFEAIPRGLCGKEVYVVTSKEIEYVNTYKSVYEALKAASENGRNVAVAGGSMIYEEVMSRFWKNCTLYISKIEGDYSCDNFFPQRYVSDLMREIKLVGENNVTVCIHKCRNRYSEHQYLNALSDVLYEGENKQDRTGTGTISMHGIQMKFDIRYSIPLLTTKKMFYRGILEEFLFFLGGNTNTKELEKRGVNFWKGNTSKEFLDSRGLDYEQGDMGPLYGFQFRHWGAEYKGCKAEYKGKGIDQIENVIKSIRNNPFSRRHVISSWNVSDIDKMVLPPCHVLVQFLVDSTGKWLDTILYQRSGDMFLGVPFNICSYSLMARYVAERTGLRTRMFIHNIGDAHIYSNHVKQVKKQLKREPYPFPNVIRRRNRQMFELQGYISHPRIAAKMAV